MMNSKKSTHNLSLDGAFLDDACVDVHIAV